MPFTFFQLSQSLVPPNTTYMYAPLYILFQVFALVLSYVVLMVKFGIMLTHRKEEAMQYTTEATTFQVNEISTLPTWTL